MLRTAALLTLLASSALAQDKTFDFKGIDSIDARNGVHVTVVPGDEITVTATARSGDVDKLVIQKFGPWLALNRDTRWIGFTSFYVKHGDWFVLLCAGLVLLARTLIVVVRPPDELV
mgnify:CR=1 FL=1